MTIGKHEHSKPYSNSLPLPSSTDPSSKVAFITGVSFYGTNKPFLQLPFSCGSKSRFWKAAIFFPKCVWQFQIACTAISRTYTTVKKVSSKFSLRQANKTASITITVPMPVWTATTSFFPKRIVCVLTVSSSLRPTAFSRKYRTMNLLVLPWKTNKNTSASVSVKQTDRHGQKLCDKACFVYLLFENVNFNTGIWKSARF